MKGNSCKAVVAEARGLLAERDGLRQRLAAIETRRERATRKEREIYEAAIAPANERFDAQAAPLRARKLEIEAEVRRLLLAQIENGVAQIPQVESEGAIAEVTTRPTREVVAKELFDAVPVSERAGAFWDCFKVMLQKADKWNSALVAKLQRVTHSHDVMFRDK